MTFDASLDKRQNRRYLCDEYFVCCELELADRSLDMTAIDFNKEGMGLFSNEHLPESGAVRLKLAYHSPVLRHDFSQLNCSIVYCNLTEVGAHCGIRFDTDPLSPAELKALAEIESCLANQDDPDDRYHLFGKD